MKTASLPSVRVEPALRAAAESVLQEGESLSSFVAQSVRAMVQQRQQQEAFIARGLAARTPARESGDYLPAGSVTQALESRLHKARGKSVP